MNEKSYCVYKHTTPSGKVYIGITKQRPQDRWQNGNGYKNNARFFNAIKKYGWQYIQHEVLFKGLTYDEACKAEIELIQQYDSTSREHGYNIEPGGDAPKMQDETKKKIGASIKLLWADETHRALQEEKMRGVRREKRASLCVSTTRTLQT